MSTKVKKGNTTKVKVNDKSRVTTPLTQLPYSKLQTSNLQVIEGIGPKLEAILKYNGISNWKILSTKSVGELKAILDNKGTLYNILIDPTSWPLQALMAHNNHWKELRNYQFDDNSEPKCTRVLKEFGHL